MKTKIAIWLFMLLLLLQSCMKTVPKVVNDAFINKFLGAMNIVWEKGPQLDWMATFYMDKFYFMIAYYTQKGEFEAFEIEIFGENIPKKFVTMIYYKYPNATIFNVFEKNRPDTTDYIFEVENEGSFFGIYFLKDGTSKIIPTDDRKFSSRIRLKKNKTQSTKMNKN